MEIKSLFKIYEFYSETKEIKEYIEVKGNYEINVTIYVKSYFKEKLEENYLQFLMILFLPKEKIILEREIFNFEIEYSKLELSVIKESNRHLHSLEKRYMKEKKINKIKI